MFEFDFDYSQIQSFADNFEKKLRQEAMLMDVFNKLGNLFIEEVKSNTPVGQYDNTVFFVRYGKLMVFESERGSGRVGGQLRRNWNLDGISKSGGGWVIEISNNTEYASFVEEGHRNYGRSGWTEGQFFLKITMEEIKPMIPHIIGPGYLDYLKSFGVD